MIKKDKSIIELIEWIKTKIGFDKIGIVDYWDSDLCAIGLKKDNKLVYISTYNHFDSPKLLVDFDLDITEVGNQENYYVLEEKRNSTKDELVKEIIRFMNV